MGTTIQDYEVGMTPVTALVRDIHPLSGEGSSSAILTECRVLSIRREYATGLTTYAVLAEAHGVTIPTIQAVVVRKTWKHLPREGRTC